MTTRYGVSIASYGGLSLVHAQLRSELAFKGVQLLELRGSPYPEMARAEQVRQALASDVETLVFVDPSVDVALSAIEKIVEMTEKERGITIVGSDDWSRALDLAAVHREVLEKMVEEEKRRYSNSAVDTVWSGKSVPAVPLASPWNRDGSTLVQGNYLTDSEAFMIRAGRALGSRVQRLMGIDAKFNRRKIVYGSTNVFAPITREPGSCFALCIPSFGALDADQHAAVFQLERAGMTVLRIHDCPWIDMARSWLSERALELGKGVFFLDHDIQFHPNDVLRLCEQALDVHPRASDAALRLCERAADGKTVVAGAYCMRKAGKNLIGSFDLPPGPLTFFEGGGTWPAFYSGLGFAAIPKEILEGMDLPSLWAHELGRKIRPWFALDCSTGFYAGEDVSFCNRVHDLTVKQRQTEGGAELEWEMTHSGRPARVFIDTRVRLAHRGSYDYGIEDAGCVVPRYQRLEITMTGSRAEAKAILAKVDDLPVEERLDMLDFEKKEELPKTEVL
jgi:hypothetical protein